ncbi:hypothetical protein BDW60DRAFT_193667 [Aspergillus nidulans var. acristatus]
MSHSPAGRVIARLVVGRWKSRPKWTAKPQRAPQSSTAHPLSTLIGKYQFLYPSHSRFNSGSQETVGGPADSLTYPPCRNRDDAMMKDPIDPSAPKIPKRPCLQIISSAYLRIEYGSA